MMCADLKQVSHEISAPGISAAEWRQVELTQSQFLLLAGLMVFSFLVLLSMYHIADGDLWAKLSLGASVWLNHEIPRHDTLAFTPVLPKYIDHEWGAGVVFYGILKFAGPNGLMLLKAGLFFIGLIGAALAARNRGVSWPALFLLGLPCAFCVLPSYIPTVRSHAFTFAFFGLLLWWLEEVRACRWGFGVLIAPLIGVWANMHGGFVAGWGAIFIYSLEAVLVRKNALLFVGLALASMLITFCNPYGLDFWRYLLPALAHPRARIEEWTPLPLFAADFYWGFRILFLLMLGFILTYYVLQARPDPGAKAGRAVPRAPNSWRKITNFSWAGFSLLLITAFLGWKSRRHSAFLGLAALAYGGVYAQAILAAFASRIRFPPSRMAMILHGMLAVGTAFYSMPRASWEILAPVGHDPVREADILAQSQFRGNLAVPFGWGSYASWRLYPKIKISHDGRYEAAYPESTFELNNDFFEKRGSNWDRLIRQYPVDFVMLDLQHERLRPRDLENRGYVLVWLQEDVSALMVLEKHAPALSAVARNLPPYTINPLDAAIPAKWWSY